MFNITKVNSQIRKSGHIFWYRDEHSDYVSNGYWIIKADLKKEKYRKILSVLVERLGAIPQAGEGLQRVVAYKKEDAVVSVKDKFPWMNLLENKELDQVKDTGLVYLSPEASCRVFCGNTDYIYISSKFMEMVDVGAFSPNFEGKGNLDPITIRKDEEMAIFLPVRMGGESEHLKDIAIKEIKKDPQGCNPKGQ